MNELSQINTGGQISFSIRQQRPLTFHQSSILKLIKSCLAKSIVLDSYILQDWFMEEIIKPRNRTVDGKYLGYRDEKGYAVFEKILEYDLLKRSIKERCGLMDGYYLVEAKQILKCCIGALVVRGYLMAIPNVQIEDIPEQKNLNQ